ncbi:cation diffusion facilitator family transporter [Domibacillus sp. DTU_2020_1001157_1_SI_ALB_TIR_016]|uniref:cation diffusion facilitator family transporter n=1 Tax=Domibacillus sp. DTU_2020_1001157_1_SI_ALB_TIR_016 TaxID=3077789 RepID=UPI0028E5AE90|nr:cation diffusion facilitator family transporter [Domibacillus sp. DTU_2020_1001157_1_SI_ALB_TIR_016]WNS81040.1 cation diffusion facilitator family transporter [Domibacillus sp. DTU_2020_1001157_1_SI_ALB_TIR_016]
METAYEDLKKGERGAWISIAAYLFLSAVKLTVGWIGNSEALKADGLNNSTDIIASVAILIGLRIARRPPDENHRYGHFRAETVASLLAAFIMASVAIQVLLTAGQSLFQANHEAPDMFTAWTALGAALVMYGVYLYNRRLAQKINSQSILAAAHDNRSDALVSVGAFVGIIGSRLGLGWLDTLTAFVVGLIILKTAWDIFSDASLALTDAFDLDELKGMQKTVEKVPGVRGVPSIKARSHGNITLVDVVLLVDPGLNVIESHDITEYVEEALLQEHGIRLTHIHIEPDGHK